MELIGTELISEFVDTIIYTGFLRDDAPQSAILISSPESGKTSVVTDKESHSVLVCSDMIGSGLIAELARKPQIRHIVINDMIAVMAHKPITNQKTWAFMSALMEEGLGKIIMPGDLSHDFSGRKAGFICCIPGEIMKDQRRWWNSSGFTSRTIPFNYEYSRSLQIRIKKEIIVTGAYEHKKIKQKLVTPNRRFQVDMPEPEAKRIQVVADQVAGHMDEKGLRKGKQFRALARGHALLNRRKEVNQDDINFLVRISKHISFSNAEELSTVKKVAV